MQVLWFKINALNKCDLENSTAKCFSCGLDINFSNIKQHPWITHALFMEKYITISLTFKRTITIYLYLFRCDHVLRTKGNEFIVRYKRIKSTGSAVARSPVRTQSLHVQTEELSEYSCKIYCVLYHAKPTLYNIQIYIILAYSNNIYINDNYLLNLI